MQSQFPCGLRLSLGSSMQYKVYGHVGTQFGAIEQAYTETGGIPPRHLQSISSFESPISMGLL